MLSCTCSPTFASTPVVTRVTGSTSIRRAFGSTDGASGSRAPACRHRSRGLQRGHARRAQAHRIAAWLSRARGWRAWVGYVTGAWDSTRRRRRNSSAQGDRPDFRRGAATRRSSSAQGNVRIFTVERLRGYAATQRRSDATARRLDARGHCALTVRVPPPLQASERRGTIAGFK
jgi:hypothetical protein